MQPMKQRKIWLVLPLLVIPFLTLGFWALGGGKDQTGEAATTKGLNLALPDARLPEQAPADKLSFYEKANADSLKMEEWMRNDPYFKRDSIPDFSTSLEELSQPTASKYKDRLIASPYSAADPGTSDQLLQKLQVLQAQLDQPGSPETTVADDPALSAEVNRLESLLQSASASGDDPEMKQLQGTLDRILDIQHPERVKERSLKDKAVYAVRKDKVEDTLVQGFYSINHSNSLPDDADPAIEAIVAADQVIVNGAVVKFRLLQDVFIQGQLIPRHTLISGIAGLNGERLMIEIQSIRSGASIYSVKLDVYDMDGLPGIYIPGTIDRDVAKESLHNSLSLADMTAVDPSLKAQAAATGIGALKSLVSKKAKLVRVQLKAGYQVLLHNKS